ncbi:uncharacterized protein LOC120215548 [Hibiscus syriacus]|uniref:uncharacterized protein LOC120215548 n=1 Tax=Hibiscus syriacus TaxID=106335 RepID=UPI001924D5A1|nr:uncharacterized protein LOC120215548 [Hibiscus syriacus]
MAIFLAGIDPNFANVVALQHYVEIKDMVHMAMKGTLLANAQTAILCSFEMMGRLKQTKRRMKEKTFPSKTKKNKRTTKHPHSYKLQWLNDEGELRVTKQVLISFSIGKYKDEVLCDVVPVHEFEDLFSEEIPSGLPPIHGFEHQIDFVPKATILNPPAYQSNLEKTKELQRKAVKLMENGYVRKYVSPCVVLVLLVPKKMDHGTCV